MFVANPLFTGELQAEATMPQETPNQSFTEGIGTRITSTPLTGLEEESTRHASENQNIDTTVREHQPVDMIVENPVFGSGLRLKKASQLFAMNVLIQTIMLIRLT